MKSIKELKEEQYDLKAKLHEIIELINGEQYYELPDSEKSLINQQRVGMSDMIVLFMFYDSIPTISSYLCA